MNGDNTYIEKQLAFQVLQIFHQNEMFTLKYDDKERHKTILVYIQS